MPTCLPANSQANPTGLGLMHALSGIGISILPRCHLLHYWCRHEWLVLLAE